MFYTAYGTQEFIDYLQKIENFDVKSFFLEMGSVTVPEVLQYESDDIAIIHIKGGLTRYAPHPMIKSFIGGTGYDEIIDAVDRAEDSGVKNIKLFIDSPGGDAAGCELAYSRIMKARDNGIYITAINKGKMLSAGYYLASAANEILSESPEFQVGSIGTIIYTRSFREMEESAGVKEIIIRSVNAPNKGQPIDLPEGRAQAQESVNVYERFFHSAISRGRGIKISEVVKNFGGGSLYVSEDPDEDKSDAISIGMIDGLLNGKKREQKKINDLFLTNPARIARNENTTGGIVKMNSLSEVFAAHPALKFEFDAAINQAKSDGIATAKAETEKRVSAAAKILESDSYNKHVKAVAAKVIVGETEISALDTMVAMADMMAEKERSDDAQSQGKNDGDIAAESTTPGVQSGDVVTAEDYIARHKSKFGGSK